MILVLLLILVAFVVVERRQSQALEIRVTDAAQSVGWARELSLYVQYNAHDTNAYTLGHLEHRQEYVEHAEAFGAVVERLQERVDNGQLDAQEGTLLAEIRRLREAYDSASESLFAAADVNRETPTSRNQAREDAAWEVPDGLGDDLDTLSQELAVLIDGHLKDAQAAIWARNNLAALLTLGLAAAIAALIVLIQRRAAKAEAAEAALVSIVENSSDAILSTNTDDRIVTWNESAAKLYGYSKDEILGRAVALLAPPDRLPELNEVLRRAMEGRTVSDLETESLSRAGERIPVSMTFSPMKDAAKTIVGTSVIVRNITQRKLAERELQQAKDRAEAGSRAKSEFLATMSHEIRTPMNGVIGLTSLLMETSLDDVQRQYMEGVHGAGQSLLTVINDILDFSKLEASKVELEVVDFDIRAVVDEIGSLLAPAAYDKGLELLAYCLPDVPEALKGDPGRIRQVLLNLAANAVKFTADGEVAIKVTSSAEENNQISVRFEVRDTGIGVNSNDRERLFTAFSQGDSSTTRRYGGTGLGLAISTRLVDAMDGRLDVDSVLGEGSTFWFELPLTIGAALPPEEPQLNRDQLSGMRALVVDDNATNRLVVTSLLTSWGLHAVAVPDAQAALDELRSKAANGVVYDIAVLDMCMPDMDGLELAQAITADLALSTTRIIMLTSTLDIDPTELKKAGISQWLTKPVRNSQFYDRLSRLVSQSPHNRISPSRSQIVQPTAGSRARVLVVEDNALNQLVAEGLMSKLGYTVDIVSDGAQALETLASTTTYAAILMDCHMPVMDGFEATVKIRQGTDSNSTIPIIAMTAGAMAEDRERCIQAGMDDHVAKPIDIAVLESILHKWVRTAAVPAELTSRAAPSPKLTGPSMGGGSDRARGSSAN